MIHTHMAGNLRVAQTSAFRMSQRGLHRPMFVVVGAPEAIRFVGGEAVPLSIFLGSLMQFARDFVNAALFGCLDPVEAVGKPCLLYTSRCV